MLNKNLSDFLAMGQVLWHFFSNNYSTSCSKIGKSWAFTNVYFIPEKGGIVRNSKFRPALISRLLFVPMLLQKVSACLSQVSLWSQALLNLLPCV